MVIDSPIISGSYSASGSYNQIGNVTITGSLAVSGALSIVGTQTVSGSIIPAVNNVYDLGDASHQFRHLYLSSGSLYIDGAKVLSSTTQELQITTDTGQSIKILEAGSDTISLQSADGNITLATSGGGDVILDPNTGVIALKGTTTVYTGYKIVSSDGNPIQFGNALAVTGSIVSTNTISATSFTGSLAGTATTASSADDFLVRGTLTAQTINVQTITSSIDYVTGSTRFGSISANTHQFTGSITVSGSLAVNGSNVILSNQTSSISVATASYVQNAVTASYVQTATTASYWSGSITNAASSSYALTASYSANVPITSSYANNAASASYALTASYSANVPVTSSYANNSATSSYSLTSSFSLSGGGFPYSGSALITGSLLITNLGGSDVRYLVTDNSGNITAQSASAAIINNQVFTSSAGQTTFTITNGYTTGLIETFINGTKLTRGLEYTDTSGTSIVLLTGSFAGDIVEFVSYQPASGVTNNNLRQVTYFTASAGQTTFSASYVPGLLDVFYNGAKLTNATDYTAANGTSIIFTTASNAGDIVEVDVYSYQVGAFSGIGGTGVANQVAYFNTTNSITGSPNFTISGSTMTVTGSLTVSGSGTFTNIGPAVFSGSITSTAGFTGSFSGTATSASYAANADLLDGLDSTVFTTTSSFNAQTASFTAFTASINTTTSSFSTRVGALESYTASQTLRNTTYATTGSNTFIGSQVISGSLTTSGSITSTSTITAQTLVVQTITSSVVYSSGSNIFGNSLANTQVFSGSIIMNPGGLFVSGSGQIGINTTTPNLSTWSGAARGMEIYGSTGQYAAIKLNTADLGNFYLINGVNQYWIYGEGNYPMTFYTSGSERMRITNSGSVGIGTTNPGAKLTVIGADGGDTIPATYGGTIKIVDYGINGPHAVGGLEFRDSNGYGSKIYTNSSTDYLGFASRLGSATWTEHMVIKQATGNVGIGTCSPSGLLQVGVANSGIYFDVSTQYTPKIKAAGTISDIQIESVGSGGNVYLTAPGATSLITLATAGSERMRIGYNGYVSVGSFGAPQALLHVSGSGNPQFILSGGSGAQAFMQVVGSTEAQIGSLGASGNITLYAGGDRRVYISSAGLVTMPNQPAFSVGNGAASTGPGTVPLKNIIFDDGSNFNTSTYRFTAPIAGRYFFSFYDNVLANSTASAIFRFRVNNAYRGAFYYQSTKTTGLYYMVSFQQVIKLNAGDYVDVENASVDSPDYGSDTSWGNFSGYLIG